MVDKLNVNHDWLFNWSHESFYRINNMISKGGIEKAMIKIMQKQKRTNSESNTLKDTEDLKSHKGGIGRTAREFMLGVFT